MNILAATRRGPVSRDRELRDFFTALAAAILTILPLRLVLAPPDISGLSRTVLVLGVGLLSLVSIMLEKSGLVRPGESLHGDAVFPLVQGTDRASAQFQPLAGNPLDVSVTWTAPQTTTHVPVAIP